MDFFVVLFSIISIIMSGGKLKTVKILRLLRILRPLRVISRNKGLKIGIQALFRAIPDIFNVIVILFLFFVVLGIIGVNYFKGTFFTCIFSDNYPLQFAIEDIITTKYDCINLGGAWVNAD